MNEGQLLSGRYRLADRLGEGGMSVVWRAEDEVLGRPVAVKVLAGTFAADTGWRRRIRTEARAAASLSHPNVTNVYDYGETAEGTPFVVMELLRGPTLADRLTAGPLRPAAAIRLCAEVAAGLAAAHAEGFVHRDVKPANIVLTPGAAKLVDFGIVGIPGDPGSGLDADGLVLGTPAYLAPERLVGDDAVPASDVYAFGLLLYRCLTGRLPWDSETTTQMLRSHVTVAPEPLPDLPDVPAQVRDLCMRCLVKAPAARPSAEEAAAVLAEAAGVSPRPEVALVRPVPAAAVGVTEEPADATALVVAGSAPVWGSAPDAATDAATGAVTDTATGAVTGVATDAVPFAAAAPPGEGATDVIGDDAGDRRRVLAGLAVVIAVAALLVTFVLNRPSGGPQASAEAARGASTSTSSSTAQAGGPAPSGDPGTSAAADPTAGAAAGQPAGEGGPAGGPGNGSGGNGGGGAAGTKPANDNGKTPGNGNGGGATTPAAGPPVRIATLGGVIVAVCNGGKVDVKSAEPAPGGKLVSLQDGPRDKSRVEFNVAGVRLRFEVRCVGGVPVAAPD